ncbi:Signal transducer regulating beta-lactamase production, contains metallopeptidase domain [Dyadobacter sp. SG02]|uniref:M56 family metallopeptidase n=1 Tax=Dyadobacter sp. SG02 TaxID=1855291 RepID=UPI0008B4C8FE|nr:M56 family metallopeptidase [Dyadobacter sp. SG02]SEI43589.1 Signal transducer regulating beta-lactamase production, contains metallopeptidase domain [Dyadobacter sp. SG02]
MLIPYLMKVSLVLAVLTLAYRWLIQFETFSKLNRVLLWLNVFAAWTLPLISLPSWGPVEVQSEFHHSIPKVVDKLPALMQPIATIQSQPYNASAESAASKMTAADWISAIYFSGLMVMAVYFLFQIGRLALVVARSRHEEYPDGTSIVHVTGASPFSFFKWIILDSSKHSHHELCNILAHEAEHARQWHSADLLLAEIQKICLWFNPFSWIHQRLVQQNLEYLADRAVLNNGFEKKQYQYNLLNALMQTRELPLTNSFAQSLLKKRIKMMNRKPSHYMAWGKYAAVLALIYISSAFVAPYRELIVELAPEVIQPLVKPLIGEVIVAEPAKKDSTENPGEQKKAPEPQKKENDALPAIDTIQTEQEPKVKGVLLRNDTLYWAITPMMTWDDINALRNVVHEFGAELTVNKLQFDPLQEFISSVSVLTRSSKGGSSGSGSRAGSDEYTPFEGYSGYIRKDGIGMGQLPPVPLINDLKSDVEKAMMIKKKNEVAYFEHKFKQNLNKPGTNAVYPRKMLSDKLFEREGIGKSLQNTLKVPYNADNSEFYLNTRPATRDELNAFPIDQVEKVSVTEIRGGKKYYFIYTK